MRRFAAVSVGRSDYGIYGTDAGRMCVAALNHGNLSYVADAIAAVRSAH